MILFGNPNWLALYEAQQVPSPYVVGFHRNRALKIPCLWVGKELGFSIVRWRSHHRSHWRKKLCSPLSPTQRPSPHFFQFSRGGAEQTSASEEEIVGGFWGLRRADCEETESETKFVHPNVSEFSRCSGCELRLYFIAGDSQESRDSSSAGSSGRKDANGKKSEIIHFISFSGSFDHGFLLNCMHLGSGNLFKQGILVITLYLRCICTEI